MSIVTTSESDISKVYDKFSLGTYFLSYDNKFALLAVDVKPVCFSKQ